MGTNSENVISGLVLILMGLSAVGLLSMAIVDIAKLVLQPRKFFYRYHVLSHMHQIIQEHGLSDNNPDFLKDVEKHIATITTGGDLNLLYRLDIEILIAQIKSVTNLADAWPAPPNSNSPGTKTLQAWSRNIQPKDWQEYEVLAIAPERSKEAAAKLDALRSNIATLIDSNLHSVQILVNYRWKLTQQITAVLVSIALIISFRDITLGWLVFAVFGGFLAPFSHDFVSILTKARNAS